MNVPRGGRSLFSLNCMTGTISRWSIQHECMRHSSDVWQVALWFIALIKEKPQCFEPWHHLHWQRFVALSPVSYDLSLCERFIVHLRVVPEFRCELWDECFSRRGRLTPGVMSTTRTLSFPPAWSFRESLLFAEESGLQLLNNLY